jgi:ribosome maturation factor RimP
MEHNELDAMVTSELEVLGFECVKLEVVGTKRSPIIRIYIDRPEGVSIKDCAKVSRTIGMVLEKADPFPGRYLLEVSSPGNNRPLTREAHFKRFVGERARVECYSEALGRKTYTGNIRSCINGMLAMDTDFDKKQKQTRKNKDEKR